MPLSGIAIFYSPRRFYILMRRTTISHFSFLISHSIRAFTHHQWAVRPWANHCTYSNQKSEPFFQKGSDHLVPEAGLEPARCRHRQILSLVRLPFRHSGISTRVILAYDWKIRQWSLKTIHFDLFIFITSSACYDSIY